MVQITDKEISTADLDKSIKYTTDKLLRININKPDDDILEGFRNNGRRDVRAAQRKGAEFVQVLFDEEFAENYYNQLIDVFAKHWSENGIKNLDLSGYREYKLKYNPEIIEVPII